jgi:Icc-related predicted phosphoesterase
MKMFIGHTEELAAGLEEALAGLRADVRIALTHYAPVDGTLAGERPEIFPFLGSYLLAEAIDRAGADLAIHGHAHRGTERGVTAGGVAVRNVAETVIGHAYKVYRLGARDGVDAAAAGRPATRSHT